MNFQAAGKFYSACKNISTRNALETLNMFNAKRNSVHRSNARIKVQTTSVARRKNVGQTVEKKLSQLKGSEL